MIFAKDLAEELNARLIGPNNHITDICSLDNPKAGCIAFLRGKALPENLPNLGALIVNSEVQLPENSEIAFLISKDPVLTFSKAVPKFREKFIPPKGVHKTSVVDETSSIGIDVSISAYVVIERNCSIGDYAVIYPHVVIYPGCEIGRNVTIHSHVTIREGTKIKDGCTIQPGAVIGGDGFGYVLDPAVGLVPVPQVGNVVLEERVDIGSNSCIDRATIGETRIRLGTKIDNLVQVGHNVDIGEHSIVCGQAGIAGSTKLGKKVVLGGQVGVADHKVLADEVRVAASSAVITNLPEKGDYSGFPAIKATTWRRIQVTIQKLVK